MTNALLTERRSTHGEFTDHARIVCRLKALVYEEMVRCGKVDRATAVETSGAPLFVQFAEAPALDVVISEALDMICHKLGRIIAGDASFKDHWVDIAGYATLVADRVPDRNRISRSGEGA